MISIELEQLSEDQKEIIIKAYKNSSAIKKADNNFIDLLKRSSLINTDLENDDGYTLSEEGVQLAKILSDKKRIRKKEVFFKWTTLIISIIALLLSFINTFNDIQNRNDDITQTTFVEINSKE